MTSLLPFSSRNVAGTAESAARDAAGGKAITRTGTVTAVMTVPLPLERQEVSGGGAGFAAAPSLQSAVSFWFRRLSHATLSKALATKKAPAPMQSKRDRRRAFHVKCSCRRPRECRRRARQSQATAPPPFQSLAMRLLKSGWPTRARRKAATWTISPTIPHTTQSIISAE